MSDEHETPVDVEEPAEVTPGASSGRPAPPPYPSQRVRTHRATQPETPYSRVTPPPPVPLPDSSAAFQDRVPEVPPPAPPTDDDWAVATQPRIEAPLPSSRAPKSSRPPLAPLVPLVPRPSSSVPRPSTTPRPSRPSPAPLAAPSNPAPRAPSPVPQPSSPAPRAPSPVPEPPAASENGTPAPRAEQPSVEVALDPEWQEDQQETTPIAAAVATPPPEPPPKPAGPPVQITKMRIIAIGTPQRVEEPIPVASDEIEVTEQLEPEPAAVAIDVEPPQEADDSEDLLEDDVPPDSVPVIEEEANGGATVKADAKPPPPPRRALVSTPAADPDKEIEQAAERARKAAEEAARKQRRAWWEVLFSEDFNRANARLSDDQIVREVNFIEESLGVATSGVVLDLGCGTGYHAVELASRGYGVVGYDLSLFQLALAADVAQERGTKLNLLQGDMREMAFEEMFDGIFCWNTSFGYFEEDKNLNVAQRIFRALRPGGMFLLDVANRDFVAMNQPSSVWYEGDSCVCMDDMQMDFISSRMRVKRSLILDDGRTRECVYSIRLYTLHELGKLLHDVGFKVTEASGHPATPGVFFGQNSPRIIMLAERP